MTRKFSPKMLTANDLRTGRSVWRTADDTWAATPASAAVYTIEEVAFDALSRAEGEAGTVVGPYLADAVGSDAGAQPAHIRERIRVAGPSEAVLPATTET